MICRSILRLAWLGSAFTLLLAAPAWAAASVKLTAGAGHPKSNVWVSGTGFAPGEAIDVYFDTSDTLLVFANASGNFGWKKVTVPASAVPGVHWISAVGRKNGDGNQTQFNVRTNWAELGFDERGKRTNLYENVLDKNTVQSLDLAWAAKLGGGLYSGPTLANGLVYVTTSDSKLHAFDIGTGAEKWVVAINAVRSAPAVANGILYVGAANGQVYALNATTGQTIWTGTTGDIVWSPVIANGVVYAGSYDGKLYAFRAVDGDLLWSAQTGGSLTGPAVANGMVYVGSSDNYVYAFDAATGQSVWTFATGFPVYASPAVANGAVYVGSYGKAYAVSATNGTQIWAAQTSGYYTTENAAAIANGTVYISSDNGALYALDSTTGATKWTAGVQASIPAVANGVVYIATPGRVYGVDPANGATLWSAITNDNCGSGYCSSPIIVDGRVYVGSTDGHLYVYAIDGGRNAVYRRKSAPPSYSSLHPNFRLTPMR